MQIIYIFLFGFSPGCTCIINTTKGLFLVQYFTQKLVKNRSQNIVNYILIMAWLCANAGYILSAKEKLALGRGERLMPWCPLVPTTVAILPKCSQCLNQIIISVFFRVVRAGPALLHSGNQQGTGHL